VKPVLARTLRSLQHNILAGIITIGPLVITYLVFRFLLDELAQAGLPMIQLLATVFPKDWLRHPMVQPVLAIVLTLVMLFVVGRVTSLVIGQQALELFEAVLERLTAKKESSQRVVLVDFPLAGQKAIGFLTRTMTDETSGELLAAVLVPCAINPTSAFLQIMPYHRMTETGLTMEQAMSMIMTGGAVGPETIRFTQLTLAAEKDVTLPAPSA
jgi:uncharacterized membrane protein